MPVAKWKLSVIDFPLEDDPEARLAIDFSGTVMASADDGAKALIVGRFRVFIDGRPDSVAEIRQTALAVLHQQLPVLVEGLPAQTRPA